MRCFLTPKKEYNGSIESFLVVELPAQILQLTRRQEETFDMKEVKEIYLREGTSFLKNRQDIRPSI